MDRIHTIFALRIIRVCHLALSQTQFFPTATPTLAENTTTTATHPYSPSTTKHPIRPVTPPRLPPHAHRQLPIGTRVTTPTLAHIPLHRLPYTHIRMVRLSGDLATCLEDFMKAGHTMSSYALSDTNLDAHAVVIRKIIRLRSLYPRLLSMEAPLGRGTRLPSDTRAISPDIICIRTFLDGVFIILLSTPMK